ncbi:MAG: hypothetical protein QM703_08295 [Gemmatales bacterium]
MLTLLCASALCIAQVQVPPIQNPPVQNPPGQLPNNQDPSKSQISQGQYGSMYQVPVDGTYQILAYEKFGQILPGMNTLKVVIRNNILTFPGDGKFPGKMIQLAFGPNNTIMLTPLDSSKPNPWQTGAGMPPNTPIPQTNQTTSNPINTVPNPVNTNPQNVNGGVAPTGIIQPTANSERGVYVHSTEFFSISVIGATNEIDQKSVQPPVSGTDNGTLSTKLNGTLSPPGAGTVQPPGFRDPNLPLPRQPQPPSTTTQPPPVGSGGAGNQAVLVLRRLAN